MGILCTWIGFTLLAAYFYKVKERVVNKKLSDRQRQRYLETDYITRKGL